MTVVIDGVLVDASRLSPELHRYIGSFRPATPPTFEMPDGCSTACFVACSCGEHLWTLQKVRAHWALGCFDVPQYETLKVSAV